MDSAGAIVVAGNDSITESTAFPMNPVPVDVLLVLTQYLTLRQAREKLEAQEEAAEQRVLERMTARGFTMLEHPLGTVLRVDAHERGQQLDVKAAKDMLAAANLPIPMRPVFVRPHIKVLDLGRTAEDAASKE
jgi:hypothetical protein